MTSGKNKSRYRAGKKRTGGTAPAAPPARAQLPPAVVIQHSTPAPPGWSQGAYDALMGVGMTPEAHAAMLDAARTLAAKAGLPEAGVRRMMLETLFSDDGGPDPDDPSYDAKAWTDRILAHMTPSERGYARVYSHEPVATLASNQDQGTHLVNEPALIVIDAATTAETASVTDSGASDGDDDSTTKPSALSTNVNGSRACNKDAAADDGESLADTEVISPRSESSAAAANHIAAGATDSSASGDHSAACIDKLDSTKSDTTPDSIPAPPPTQSVTYNHSDIIMQSERHGMLLEICTLQQARILVYFACFFICTVIRRHNKSDAIPPNPFVNRLHRLVLQRGQALLRANGHFADDYSQDKSIMPSVIAHAAMLCAQEYMKVHFLDTVIAMRTLKMAVQQEKGSDRDHEFLGGFITAWLDKHSADQKDVHIYEMDGIQVGDRMFDLQVHFGKAKPWPRTIHGTRVMPFGVVDLLDKVKFAKGEKSRACLNCRAKYKSTRAWREHLLTTTEHEVYLCCGRQFASPDLVLEHLVEQHKGGLGAVDAFIQRAYPPMQMWDE